ncbi:methionine--tRNA ligase [bacterium]|nr:methionine--tRNA ligase [bacterium]MBT5014998.1 methionine--tRNA ligase [bacterium]
MNKFYVTTPIYYVTAKPHLGTLYTTVLADVINRWQQIQGKETFFLTGTDEHGQKIAMAADKAGKSPKEFTDSFIDAYKDTWKEFEIDYSHFIRTTDEYHVKAIQQWLQKLIDKGDIYKSSYNGWYCTPCETFLSDKETEGAPEDKSQDGPACPSCSRGTQYIEEECYFFKLSKYQDRLLDFYKSHPDFIFPQERGNEVVSFVESGLKDLCMSRTTVKWGIPFPGDEQHVAYVWADALNNYITAIGYLQEGKQAEFEKWWPANVQVMGKDIVRFHAVIWPAFLMASDLPLPEHLLVHGWIKVGDQKMSKSLGNVMDPRFLYQEYGPDAVRYFLTTQMAITQDSPFSLQDLEGRINSDLANEMGNLLNRMVTLAKRGGLDLVSVPADWSEASLKLQADAQKMVKDVQDYLDTYSLHMAYAEVKRFVAAVNAYFHAQEPWKLVKSDPTKFAEVISATAHSLYVIGVMYWPVMPDKMQALLSAIGVEFSIEKNSLASLRGAWDKSFTLEQVPVLFKKIERKKVSEEVKVVEKKEEVKESGIIDIKDFMKVNLVVGTIESAEAVEGSDKLLKLQVNCGDKGVRQIFAGVKKFYEPEALVGKQAVFVVNLKPRKIMGMESQGMMLFAEKEDGGLSFISPGAQVPNGSALR